MLSCLTKKAWLMVGNYCFWWWLVTFFSSVYHIWANSTAFNCCQIVNTGPRHSLCTERMRPELSQWSIWKSATPCSSPHQIYLCPFLKGWHCQWEAGGFGSFAHLPFCLAVEVPAWESAVMLVLGCGLEQNWNGCFPSGSEQLSYGNKCQYPTAGACFLCVHMFVSCVCNFWTITVLWSSFFFFWL